MRFTLAVALMALTLVSVVAVNRADAAEVSAPSLDGLASQVVGSPVTVQCFTPNVDYAGYVILGVPIIHLDGTYCGALVNLLRTPAWGNKGYAMFLIGSAALALTHEATHLNLNSADEGLTECTAYRNVFNTLRLLPLSARVRSLTYAWAGAYHDTLPTAYRTVC